MRFVFDFGGVLLHWRPAEVVRRALPARTRDEAGVAHWVRQVFQVPGGGWGDFDRGVIDAEQLVQRIAGRTELMADEVRALIDAALDELQPIAASVALLERLHAVGSPVHFLSNMPAPFADHLESRHEFIGRFADGVFSGRVGRSKPDPQIYALAAQRFRVPPGELVFLDDHAPNVEAARAAGWRALVFRDAASCEAELRGAGWWPAQPAQAR